MLLWSYDQVLKETQDYFRQFVPSGTSVVDELLADRRDEAAREDVETTPRLPAPSRP